jgi:hypothetical protein
MSARSPIVPFGDTFVSMAAAAFINDVRLTSDYLDALEHDGFRLSDMPALAHAEGLPSGPLAGVDGRGRALILRNKTAMVVLFGTIIGELAD